MKPETYFKPDLAAPERSTRLGFALLAGVTATVLLLYWPTTMSMVDIWSRSDTFAHGYLVLPVVLWLLWQDRKGISHVPIQTIPVAVLGVAFAGFLWLLAELSAVLSLTQFALILMIQCAALALLGARLCRRIAFPLLFLYYAVPVGEFLLPTLIDRTADATVFLLRLSGVPVFREGNHLRLPTGDWSVVEACSGLRYLIASMFGGMIYAHLRYRSTRRRLAFIVVSVAVPVVANWLRAYGIVMLGHHTNNRLGASVDHIIYGWVFFGFVMVVLFWVGSFWTEEQDSGDSTIRVHAAASLLSKPPQPASFWRMAGLCLAMGAIWPIALMALETRDATGPVHLGGIAAQGQWTAEPAPSNAWKPNFVEPNATIAQRYRQKGQSVDLFIAYYRDQHQGSELTVAGNQLVYASDPVWTLLSSAQASTLWNGNSIRATSALVVGRGERVNVRRIFWIDGRYTGSEYLAKAYIARARLLGRGDDSAAIVLSSSNTNAHQLLDDFSRDISASIARALSQARDAR